MTLLVLALLAALAFALLLVFVRGGEEAEHMPLQQQPLRFAKVEAEATTQGLHRRPRVALLPREPTNRRCYRCPPPAAASISTATAAEWTPERQVAILAAISAANVSSAAEREHADDAESARAGMAICVSHDSNAGRSGAANKKKDDHAWIIRYRAYKTEVTKAEAAEAKARKAKEAAVKQRDEAVAALLESKGGGPFHQRFESFLSNLKISRAKYFGGTSNLGTDTDTTSKNPRKACAHG